MDLTLAEQRVLGCLIEKRRTTPDGYPLSLNALRTACNQASNRDPVMALTDDDVREAATGLHREGLVRIASAGQGSRTTKYRHTGEEGLPASDAELALLAVLLLRGPQTRGELRTRSERIHTFESIDEVEDTLDGLGRRGLVQVMDREPGRKESRYRHQLGERDPEVAAAVAEAAAEHRARLIAEGRLRTGDEDEEDSTSPTGFAPSAPQPAFGDQELGSETADEIQAAPVARSEATHEVAPSPSARELLARIEALERRIDELEELVAS